jgi:hypothetical protein
MTIAAIKEKLHNYISEADDEKIKNLYHIFEDQMAPAVDWSEDKEFIAELDERVRRYEEGIDPGYTWDDVEASINELRIKRAVKK